MNENVSFIDHASGIRLPDGWKLAKFPRWRRHLIFFWRCRVSLVKFSYWSKFYVNIMTGSGVMTIFIYKELTRNPEIGSTPLWILLNIYILGWVRDIKFGLNVLKKYWMLQNARVTAFTVFELLRENQTEG